MKHLIIITLFLLASACFGWERKLSVGSPTLDVDSIFQVVSTGKGSKPCPSMTTSQRTGIGSPSEGLCVWDNELNSLFLHNGDGWGQAGGGGGGVNYLTDGSFEIGVTNVTALTGSATSESSVYFDGTKSLKLDSGSGSGLDAYQCETNTNWENMSLQVSCLVQSGLSDLELCSAKGSGTGEFIQCVDYDGSNTPKTVKSSMIADSTGKACWRAQKTSTGSGVAYVDGCVIKPLEFGVEAAVGGTNSFTPTFSDETNISTKAASWTRVGDKMHLTAYAEWDGGGAGTTFTVSLPTGYTIDTSRLEDIGASNAIDGFGRWQDAGTAFVPLQAKYNSTTTIRWEELTTANIWDGSQAASGDSIFLSVTVPITGWNSSTQFLTQNYDWYVDASITGANPSLGTIDVSTYTGITDGGLSLTNNTSLSNVYIACSSTEEGDGTDCTGDESVGIAVTGWVGKVEVCAATSHVAVSDGSGKIKTAFQIVKTGNTDQTISEQGGDRIVSGPDSDASTALASIIPIKLCGIFSMSGKSTFRLFFEQDVDATATSSAITGDADGGTGQRDIHWTVKPISGTMYATLNPIRYQRNKLSSSITSADTDVDDLQFDNLVIGETYRVVVHAVFATTGNANETLSAVNNAVTLCSTRHEQDATGTFSHECEAIFVAGSTSVTFNYGNSTNADLQGDNSFNNTWTMIERLPNHQVTTEY